MTSSQLLLSWEFTPTIVIGCALMLIAYLVGVRFKLMNLKAISFISGVMVLFLALVSPIDRLADDYLFSAHMLQHMLLSIVAPPLLVAGLPASMVEAWLRFPVIARMERILSYAPLTLVAWVVTIWAWHLPYLYNLALENERIHVFEHLLIIVTGVMLWWPVLKPIQAGRLAPMMALGYMGVAATLGMILGIIFTVADTPFYAFYEHPHDELGALKLIREDWGLTQIEDQSWVVQSCGNPWVPSSCGRYWQ